VHLFPSEFLRRTSKLQQEADLDICVEQLPVSQLRPFVECIWYSDPTGDTRFQILPDGCVDACFVLSERRPRVLLLGTTTRTSAYDLEAGSPYLGVRFRPGMASVFVQEKISDLTDSELQVAGFLGVGADEVLDLRSFPERRMRLESSLMAALAQNADQLNGAVNHAVAEINNRYGDVKVRQLAASCNLSERQLERLFVEQVGITPKLYARIRRFRSVLDHLQDPEDAERPNMADVAASYGYTDQSHLARDFRNFSHSVSVPA
jgi:AraC-like DNA-binding protein